MLKEPSDFYPESFGKAFFYSLSLEIAVQFKSIVLLIEDCKFRFSLIKYF